jgi:organic hydroperoxide reductase OsmC/OhrA
MPKRFEYAASIDREGALCAEERDRLDPGETWTPEHLVLAALCRCTLSSLRFHAEREERQATGTASASGLVTKRERDGRYAFVEVLCGLDVTVEPLPADLDDLLARAERDCFVGASLTTPVEYEWRVNGELVRPA